MRSGLYILVFSAIFQFFGVGSAKAVSGETDEKDSITSNRRFLTELRYKSNTNYKGRFNDSVFQPTYSLNFKYYSRRGFKASVSLRRILNSDSSQTLPTRELDLMVGYGFNITEKFKSGFSYTRYFYSKNTELIQSAFKNNISGDFSYDFNWLYTYLSADYSFGDSKDFFLSFSNSHSFEFAAIFHKEDVFYFDPELSLDFGSQTYYTQFLTERRIKKRPRAQLPAYTQDEKFTLTGVSFILPLSYYIGKWSFDFSVNLVKPLNQPDGQETASYGYITAGVGFEF